MVSSTLAAFGPGGMVGGLVTLGVLTGTASASVGFGAALEMRADDPGDPAAAAVVNRTAGDLVALDPDPLAVTLTAMLAVLHAQAAVRSTSTAVFVRAVVSSASDRVRAEWSLHEQIAPGSAGTKQWRKKVTLLERCTAALDLLTTLPDVQALVLARTAAETGRLPATLVERAALPGPASDAG